MLRRFAEVSLHLKPRPTALVYQVYLLRSDITIVHDVPLRTLADGDDTVGLGNGLPEFPYIHLGIYPVVVFRMAHEDEVMDRYHCSDARLPDAYGQFARQTVIECNTVVLQVCHDTVCTPVVTPYLSNKRGVLCVTEVMRIDEGHRRGCVDHLP